MAIGASAAGGTHQHHAAVHSPLSAAEHHAAKQVLAKLGVGHKTSLSGHGANPAVLLKPTNDKITAGSGLHNNKVGVSGATAASVKEHASHASKAKAAKLTGSDKTAVHVTGVSLHHLTKGSGSDK
jgi:hypothetical protein